MAIVHSVLWWLILVVGIVLLVPLLRREPSADGPQGETALDILKKRYARGEIGKEEFEQMRRDIVE
jgi:putative membrane protein